ncbi:PREDICTED: lisH domain-containing protein C1711.05-like [Branchiostoma belcheri]|uniref:LisH domain-containing protein C1711.05-like n=1 Tax=Branchiostoma belcheri TaxID=7741 RepID=A0A6P5A1C1_BRABE|nr:PREDICTED: lisH domain-containing protein C1711.05-like [Branchiostoma belcheri]
MSHACDICGKEFSRKANLVRHRDTIHGDVTDMASGEEVLDAETGQNRSADIFDDTDNSSEEATTEHDTESLESSEEEVSTVSQDDVSEDESVKDSWEAESTTETESDQSGSESDASSTVSSNSSSSDECEEYGYDSGDEEERTLYRDWSIPLKHEPGDVPQRVIKVTKRTASYEFFVNGISDPARHM